MPDAPHTPVPRCGKHNLVMMWYGVTRQTPKYRCAICVADAKIKVDRERSMMRRHGHKQSHDAAQ